MKQQIEIPEGFTHYNTFYGGSSILVSLRKVKPEYKLGDVLTNGFQIWIRDAIGDAVILFDGAKMIEECCINMKPSDIRFANYEERCKFFEALVKAGYKWNSKKLKLTNPGIEPVQKFKVGDVIVVTKGCGRKYISPYIGEKNDGLFSVACVLCEGFLNHSKILGFMEGDTIRLANDVEKTELFMAMYNDKS